MLLRVAEPRLDAAADADLEIIAAAAAHRMAAEAGTGGADVAAAHAIGLGLGRHHDLGAVALVAAAVAGRHVLQAIGKAEGALAAGQMALVPQVGRRHRQVAMRTDRQRLPEAGRMDGAQPNGLAALGTEQAFHGALPSR